MMTISQAAERFGVEPHTLRYYEKEGIITPERTETGIRMYSDANIAQLEIAMCLKSTGMPLKKIKQYFDLVGEGDSTLDERFEIFNEHRDSVLEEIEVLQGHLSKIEGKIAWYSRMMESKKAG